MAVPSPLFLDRPFNLSIPHKKDDHSIPSWPYQQYRYRHDYCGKPRISVADQPQAFVRAIALLVLGSTGAGFAFVSGGTVTVLVFGLMALALAVLAVVSFVQGNTALRKGQL